MGGFGSSRWDNTVTRVTTDGLLRLDIRALTRDGCLRPGASATVTWNMGASIATEVPLDDPDHIRLGYSIYTGSGDWHYVDEQISMVSTPCTFGGTRRWFSCPGCGVRCAVLYALYGLFRCRSCHDIAYSSTRKSRIFQRPG